MTTGEPTTRVTFESGADQGIPVEHESYRAEDARAARQKTLAFFRRHLG